MNNSNHTDVRISDSAICYCYGYNLLLTLVTQAWWQSRLCLYVQETFCIRIGGKNTCIFVERKGLPVEIKSGYKYVSSFLTFDCFCNCGIFKSSCYFRCSLECHCRHLCTYRRKNLIRIYMFTRKFPNRKYKKKFFFFTFVIKAIEKKLEICSLKMYMRDAEIVSHVSGILKNSWPEDVQGLEVSSTVEKTA